MKEYTREDLQLAIGDAAGLLCNLFSIGQQEMPDNRNYSQPMLEAWEACENIRTGGRSD
tara:strand:+ start:2201 stop:2377 length:177 start_codon:yes stop_codon:yes gene_type:complete